MGWPRPWHQVPSLAGGWTSPRESLRAFRFRLINTPGQAPLGSGVAKFDPLAYIPLHIPGSFL